ncbi:MAG: PglZ domain-containing protein [Alphaproteobacteria bacterium]|nr:PglZ domain-containing protein [Alphaproteobacteria bacterium]
MIGETALATREDRDRHLRAHEPGVAVLNLDELAGLSGRKLAKAIAGARLVVVRSTEIDALGERGFRAVARWAMGNVIGTLAQVMGKLARAGVRHQVVTADHGHLFATERGEEMRIDPPGGETVELHRRCWIGRGGALPPGCLRVGAAELGWRGDLEVIFPAGLGVFRAGGDLAFHHGGISLQEVVVPVLTAYWDPGRAPLGEVRLRVVKAPETLVARVLALTVEIEEGGLFDVRDVTTRPRLVADDGRIVGHAIMALGGECEGGVVRLTRGAPVEIGMMLTDEDVRSVSVLLLDSESSADLGGCGPIRVRLGVR